MGLARRCLFDFTREAPQRGPFYIYVIRSACSLSSLRSASAFAGPRPPPPAPEAQEGQEGPQPLAAAARGGGLPVETPPPEPPAPDARPWRVAVAGSAPFVIVEGDALSGMSIDVWRSVARRADITYDVTRYDDVSTALEAVATGKSDILVGPVSITATRAKTVAFTQPYFQSRLAIASRTKSPSLGDRLAPFATLTFAGGVGSVLLVLGLVGVLIWLAERKHNDQFPKHPLPGIGNGLWLAIVTMTTVGYGDRAPVTAAGKVICGVWMVIAVLSATSLLAGIASTLTLSGLATSTIAVADDLKGARVATVAGSPAAQLTRSHGGKVVAVESLEQALGMLDADEVDAVVYDEPQLRFELPARSDLTVSDATYHPQGYGFALPASSPKTHRINVALLNATEDGEISSARIKWLPGVND